MKVNGVRIAVELSDVEHYPHALPKHPFFQGKVRVGVLLERDDAPNESASETLYFTNREPAVLNFSADSLFPVRIGGPGEVPENIKELEEELEDSKGEVIELRNKVEDLERRLSEVRSAAGGWD